MRKIDITGNKYHRLTVLSFHSKSSKNQSLWLCKCDCGKTTIAFGLNLKRGHTKSCGCLRLENSGGFKHGGYKTKEHSTWRSMRARCYTVTFPFYYLYGGRGIKICERWQDFTLFLQDMGQAPTKKHSIDRINPDGDYEPSNCRWATPREQANNKSKTKYFEFNGKVDTIPNHSRALGLSVKTVWRRIRISGLSVYEALTIPIQKGLNHKFRP